MDAEKELLKISDEMQIEIIEAMERALNKIGTRQLGGTMAQKIISFSLIYCWTLWLKQHSPERRVKLFEDGCDAVANKLLELAKEERTGSNKLIN